MSADNLISVYETNEGDFLVSMEFASQVWEIEYSFWDLEEKARKLRKEGKYTEDGQYGLFKTFYDATRSAYTCQRNEEVVEYGVQILLKEDRLWRAARIRAVRTELADATIEHEETLIERLALSRRAVIT